MEAARHGSVTVEEHGRLQQLLEVRRFNGDGKRP
jgi:hypothetical protein